MKKIELYTFVYNDEDFLPFFLKYYSTIVDKMTFIDSGSTDRTLELLKDYEVLQTGLTWWDWDALHGIRNSIWRDSKFDLVFFPDLDEIFYRPNLRDFLEENNYDVYQLEGYQMIADRFPYKDEDILSYNKGIPLPLHNKYTIFNPRKNIVFSDAHNIVKNPGLQINKFCIKLLHYKYLGAKRMTERAGIIRDRIPRGSYTRNINGNVLKIFPKYISSYDEYKVEIDGLMEIAKKVI